MKCVYVQSPFKFELRDAPLPEPGAGEALVEVAWCGICGSDMAVARECAAALTPIGHEVSGLVKAVGPGVRHVQPGQPVALDCGNTCGVCPACRAGRPRRCSGVRGFYGTQSGFADCVLAHAQNVHPVGDLDLKTACLLEPFGVAMNMVLGLEIDLLDDVLLLGPGPIGLLALCACRAAGARSLMAVGRRDDRRLAVARAIGASAHTCGDDLAGFAAKTLAGGFDKIIVTAPPAALPAAVTAAREGAVIAFCGLGHGASRVALDWDQVHGRDIRIMPMGEVPHRGLPQAIELLRRGAVPAEQIISHTFPRERIADAFGVCENRRDEAVKVVIRVKPGIAGIGVSPSQ